jgi:hypothetical protein
MKREVTTEEDYSDHVPPEGTVLGVTVVLLMKGAIVTLALMQILQILSAV